MNKVFYGIFTICFLFSFPTKAENVILMIGDGMGENHLKCAEKDTPIYIPTLPVKGTVQTRSANADVTDSAAAATAYACGRKTNNRFLGKLPDGKDPADGKALPSTTIVKGDGKYLSIAAASILAKTYRDDYMNQLAEEYPQYDWLSNKGYPTKKHRDAIRQYGITPYHRKSYNLLGTEELTLDFGE